MHKPVRMRSGKLVPVVANGKAVSESGRTHSSDAQPVEMFIATMWRDLRLVALILAASAVLERTVGGSGFGPVRIVTVVPLLVAAYMRPVSAFYAVLMGVYLRVVTGETSALPTNFVLGLVVLAAGVVGSQRAHLLDAIKTPQFFVAAFIAGWMFLLAFTFGAPEGTIWEPTVIAFASGLAFQLLVRRRNSHLSAWAAVAMSSMLLAAMIVTITLTSETVLVHGLGKEEAIADPNYLAMMIGLGIGPALILAKSLADGKRRLLAALALLGGALCFFGVVLLASRGVLIALTVSLIPVFLLYVRTMRTSTTVILLLIGLAAASGGIYWLAEYQGGEIEVIQRFDPSSKQVDPTGDRLPLARAAFGAFADAPLSAQLFGKGPYSNFVSVGRIVGTGWTHTHNAFLEYLLDYGVVGLGAILLLLWLAFRSALAAEQEVRFLKYSQLCFLMVCSLSLNPFGLLPAVIVLGLTAAPYRKAATGQRRRAPRRPRWAAARERLRNRWGAKAKTGPLTSQRGITRRGR
jgi:hypothetical protein